MSRDPDTPRLVFSPRAWLKWQFLCHVGPTEIGAFGLSSEHNPLYVDDLIVLQQTTTSVSVAFDDTAVADLFDAMADAKIPPNRFARLWLHTHPGASVTPSGVDEQTLQRVFGSCDWAVMAILGRTGRTSARLRFNAGPGGAIEMQTTVDWAAWPDFALSYDLQHSVDLWQQEFLITNHVRVLRIHSGGEFRSVGYTRKWLTIIRRSPRVKFYSYTRSWRVPAIREVLEVMAAEPNMQLWYSVDRDTGLPDAVPPQIRLAWLMTTADDLPPRPVDLIFRPKGLRRQPLTLIADSPVCPAEDGVARPKSMTCDRCKTCWQAPASEGTTLLTTPLAIVP